MDTLLSLVNYALFVIVICRIYLFSLSNVKDNDMMSALFQTFEFQADDSGMRRESMISDPTGKHRARTVDKVARKLFPASFILFNVIYWLTYIFWQPIK